MRSILLFLFVLTLAGSALAQRAVSLRTQDGWTLAAQIYGKGPRGLVLIHGGRFTKESWKKQAEGFVAAGYQVIAIDLRGFGESKAGPPGKKSDDAQGLDGLAAVRYLQRNGARRVSLIGGSMGGDEAADAACLARPGEIDRLIILGTSGGDHPERIKARKLLYIATRGDSRGNGDLRLPGIQAGYQKAPEPKTFLLLEGSAHAQFLFDTDQADRVMREILNFLYESTGESRKEKRNSRK